MCVQFVVLKAIYIVMQTNDITVQIAIIIVKEIKLQLKPTSLLHWKKLKIPILFELVFNDKFSLLILEFYPTRKERKEKNFFEKKYAFK